MSDLRRDLLLAKIILSSNTHNQNRLHHIINAIAEENPEFIKRLPQVSSEVDGRMDNLEFRSDNSPVIFRVSRKKSGVFCSINLPTDVIASMIDLAKKKDYLYSLTDVKTEKGMAQIRFQLLKNGDISGFLCMLDSAMGDGMIMSEEIREKAKSLRIINDALMDHDSFFCFVKRELFLKWMPILKRKSGISGDSSRLKGGE